MLNTSADLSNQVPENATPKSLRFCTVEEPKEVDRWYGWSSGKCRLYIVYSDGSSQTQVVDDSLCS